MTTTSAGPKATRSGRHSKQPERKRAPIGVGLVLTAVAWLASRCVIGSSWGPARNPLTFDPFLWGRWDSLNYLGIAGHGRTFGRCGSPGFPTTGVSLRYHQTWCGSAGWLPGFPWLSRGLSETGLSLADSQLLLAWVAMAAALFVVWLGWGRHLSFGRALVVMLLFGLFPGAVYNFALFPTSLALVLVVGALLAASREHFFVGAVLMTLAGLCYPSAWFAGAGLAVGLVVLGLPHGLGATVRRGLWGLAGLASLLILGIHDQIAFGHYNAFIIMDSGPGLQVSGLPAQDFLRLVFKRHTFEQVQIGRPEGDVLAVQGVVAVLVTLGAGVAAATRRARRDASMVYPALASIAVVLGLLIDSAKAGSWNRSVVLAAPSVLCLRRLPMAVLISLMVVIGVTTALISHTFFAWTLV
jgi:hypothetical protein